MLASAEMAKYFSAETFRFLAILPPALPDLAFMSSLALHCYSYRAQSA
jgi:hypothetical protein